MAEEHAEAVDQAFSSQAAAFEDRRLNRVFAQDVEWLFDRLVLEPCHVVLDVAAGTGHAARCLAPSVRMVVALDVTIAMLEAGKIAMENNGLQNVVFLRGDAAALPFLDASLAVVVSRFAVHHFERPREQLAEMVRCLRPGGQLVVADLAADEDPVVAQTHDQLEALRDPSHTRMLTAADLRATLEDLGAITTGVESREVERPLAPWLAQTHASDAVIAQVSDALRREINGGLPTGFHPRDRDGELWFAQRFASVTASKPG